MTGVGGAVGALRGGEALDVGHLPDSVVRLLLALPILSLRLPQVCHFWPKGLWVCQLESRTGGGQCLSMFVFLKVTL